MWLKDVEKVKMKVLLLNHAKDEINQSINSPVQDSLLLTEPAADSKNTAEENLQEKIITVIAVSLY